jgi:hypothetical protein
MTDQASYGAFGNDGGKPLGDGLADAAATVKAEAAHFASAAGEKAQEKLAEGQKVVGDGLGQFADALKQAAEGLEGGDQGLIAGLVKQAAEGLESVSRVVADKRPEEILHAARDFGRENPGVFLAASILAGVALGRLARASGARDRDTGELDRSHSARPYGAPAAPTVADTRPPTDGLAGDGLANRGFADSETLSGPGDQGEAKNLFPRAGADDGREI